MSFTPSANMSSIDDTDGLTIDEDLDFERVAWKVQSVGRIVMMLLVVAALLGLLGTGPLSNAAVESEHGVIRVDYNRFARIINKEEISVLFQPSAAKGGQIRFWLSRSFTESLTIEQITPNPDVETVGPDRTIYVFNVVETEKPTSVIFRVTNERIGMVEAQTGLDGEVESVAFSRLVYP